MLKIIRTALKSYENWEYWVCNRLGQHFRGFIKNGDSLKNRLNRHF